MRINWFCPIPPAKTEIANYAARVLPYLAKEAEVVVWCDSEEWDPAIEQHAEVRRYRRGEIAWTELNRADATIYHLGNNAQFHSSILDVARRHPGIVVLHDTSLQHFVAGYHLLVLKAPVEYMRQMEKYYGDAGRLAAEQLVHRLDRVESVAGRFPMTEYTIENALGAVVHSRTSLLAIEGAPLGVKAFLDLPHPPSPERPSRPTPAANAPRRLIIFGYIGANRRISSVVKALAEFPQKHQLKLDIYGAVLEEGAVRAEIEEHGLSDLVSLHGFVEEAELEAALASADLAINLRYPTAGEGSASQLRIWDHALPSLVTRCGWYAEQDSDTVAFVSIDTEIQDLHRHWKALLDNPETFARQGRAGRRKLIERHAPAAYAAALAEIARQADSLNAHATARALADRAGSFVGPWFEDEIHVPTFARIADQIHAIHYTHSTPVLAEGLETT